MDVKSWHAEILGQKVVKALQNNGFQAVFFSNKEAAAQHVLSYIKENMTVGIGGSVTLNELELPQKAVEKGAIVFNHNLDNLTAEERLDLRRKQLSCDLFLTSSNSITMNGYLVNVDATGNRVGAMVFGPKKVIIIAGVNKITKDLEAALDRIETIASPQNNKRLNLPNPCTQTGTCMDCNGKTRICNIYTIIKRKPAVTDVEVVIVGENLGY
ncbi:MAG: lactate utilization protein [Clostridia bacterium]|nr:lactate utilization protein [Clostridia bacterium]